MGQWSLQMVSWFFSSLIDRQLSSERINSNKPQCRPQTSMISLAPADSQIILTFTLLLCKTYCWSSLRPDQTMMARLVVRNKNVWPGAGPESNWWDIFASNISHDNLMLTNWLCDCRMVEFCSTEVLDPAESYPDLQWFETDQPRHEHCMVLLVMWSLIDIQECVGWTRTMFPHVAGVCHVTQDVGTQSYAYAPGGVDHEYGCILPAPSLTFEHRVDIHQWGGTTGENWPITDL